MGLFSNLLNDIASGELDKKLGKLADDMEKVASTVSDSTEHLAQRSEQVLQKVDSIGRERSGRVNTTEEGNLPR